MPRADSPFDPGADSCLSRSAQLLAVPALLLALTVRLVRRRRRAG